jgi:hypothetical protein
MCMCMIVHVHAINLKFLTAFIYRDVPPDVPWTGGSGVCWTWSQRYIACIQSCKVIHLIWLGEGPYNTYIL